jgi:hypothetical protein
MKINAIGRQTKVTFLVIRTGYPSGMGWQSESTLESMKKPD